MSLPSSFALTGAHLRRSARLTAVLTSGLAAALVLTGCGGGSSTGSPAAPAQTSTAEDGTQVTPVTVGSIPIVDVAPVYLGIKQGFFSEAGLDVTVENAQGGAAIVPAVAAGQYQFGFSNTVSLLLATASGVPLQAVSAGPAATGDPAADYSGIVVPAGSDITGPADLAGKKVAVNTLNNILTTTVNETVRQAGGDPSGIQYVELPFPEMVQAVTSGDVDAAAEVEPFVTIGTTSGLTNVGGYYAATDPDLLVAMWFTSDAYAQSNPEVVEAFSAAMAKSQQYAADNPEEARAVLSDYLKLDAAVQEALVMPAWPAEIDESKVQLLSDLAVEDGTLPSAPDLGQLLP